MHVEDFDLSSYPIKAHSSPDGEQYIGGPRAASPIWRIDYVDSNGFAKWEIYRGEHSSPVAEIPRDEIRILEKRMKSPHRITSVKFGLIYKQEEPGGQWVKFKPNDKDPRAESYFEGNYTDLYFNTWRKAAYEGHFDPFKLTRAYSEKEAIKRDVEAKDKYIKDLENKINEERTNSERLIEKNNALMQEQKAKTKGMK